MSAEQIETTILNLIDSKLKQYIEYSKSNNDDECAQNFIGLLAIAEIAKVPNSGLSIDCQKKVAEKVDQALAYIDTIEERLELRVND